VAYESLPSERRRLLHRRAVGALESLHAERRVEHVDELAHHAVRGELWEQALAYLRQAGARAAARSGFREATAHLEGALRVLAHLPESRDVLEQAIDVRVELRNALLPVGEEARIFAYLREAEAIAEALGDERRLGTVFLARTFHLIMMGAHQEALECCRRALAVATAIGSFPLEVRAKYYLGGIYEYLGDYGRAIESLRETAARLDGERIREQLGSTGYPSVLSRAWLVWCLAEVGEFAEAVARGEEMVRIAETLDDRYSSIAAYRSVGQTHLNRGDIPAAIAALERCVGLLGAAEFPRWVFGTTTLLGYAYVLSGRLFEAEPLLKQALARETPVRSTHHARLVACLGEAYLLAGHRDDAIRLAGRALSLARQRKEHSHEAHALRLLGEIDCRRDPPDLEQAEGHYRQALELAETLGMRPLAAHCRLGLGRVHGRAGRRPAAEAHLGAAVLLFRGLDMGYWLEQAESELEAIP
jgi:tetratricopeptide (TPR) repeat protein